MPDVKGVAGRRQSLQLLPVDDVLDGARRVEESHRSLGVRRCAVADHRHQRHDSRPSTDQQKRPWIVRLPHEVASDRSPQLELVLCMQLTHEVGRHLAVLQPLHCDRDPRILGRGGYRVAALGLVAIVSGQAHVDVLPRKVPRPIRNIDQKARHLRRLLDHVGDLADLPG